MDKTIGVMVSVLVMSGASALHAAEFQPLGSEAMSMGGAGVAAAHGSFAAYYNPALLARHRTGGEFALSGGIGIREINLVDAIDDLADIDLDESFDRYVASPTPGGAVPDDLRGDVDLVLRHVRSIADANGLQLMPTFALGAQVGNVGFGAYGISELTAHAIIDRSRTEFIVEAGGRYFGYNEADGTYLETTLADYEAHSLEYAVNNHLTYLQLTGLIYAEIPIAYGHAFETALGELDVGGSLKAMPGRTYGLLIDIDTSSDDIADDLEESAKDATAFGVDAGVLFRPDACGTLAVGLVGKNLNTPAFATATGGTLEVKPQVRAGVALDCFDDLLTLALDLDLTSNETLIPGLDSQFIGGGASFHPASWFSVRGGAMVNMADSNDGTILTGGIGLGLKWFQLDIAGQVSTESGTYDGQDIPRYARAQVAIVSKWY